MDFAKSLKVIALLKRNGAEITEAVIKNVVEDPEAVKYLLDEGGLDPNEPYLNKEPTSVPVRAAIRAGAMASLKLMIEAGGEIWPRSFLAIKQAYQCGHTDIGKYLIDQVHKKGLSVDQELVDSWVIAIDMSSKLKNEAQRKKVIEMAKVDLKKITK
jgi:hypothetical protein